MKLLKPVMTALIVGAGMLQFAPPALAAPGAPRHPATFTVKCDVNGEVTEVTVLEATGAAIFFADSPVQGNNAVILSARGDIYKGEKLVDSFEKTWGTKAGISNRLHCTRINTDVVNGQPYTAFEWFVLGMLPDHR